MEKIMTNIPGNTAWVAELVPGLEAKKTAFMVDTDEVDDELIEVFIEELQRLSSELQEGIDQNDSEIIRMAAHSIKGMGGTIGLPEISVVGLEIEMAAKENRMSDAIPLVRALAEWISTIS